MKTFTILQSLTNKLLDKVRSINKKMQKYGTNVLICNLSNSYYVNDKNSPFYRHYVVDVELQGHYQVQDWIFVASLEYDTVTGKNIIKCAPNGEFEIPEKYYTLTNCDHCGTQRFRKHTVLLYNYNTEEYRQVGKSCLRDYVGVDITGYAAYLASFKSLNEYMETLNKDNIKRDTLYFDVDDVLEQAIARTRDRGYISSELSRKLSEEREENVPTTASDVFHILNKTTNMMGELIIPAYEIKEEDRVQLKCIKSFIQEVDSNNNYYIHNLKTLLELGRITNDNLGLTVSMVGFYLRETAKRDRENQVRETSKSKYIGNIGDKFTFTATPKCVSSIDTEYGVMRIYEFVVGDDIVIWKTSKYLEDAEITLKGTIKGHNEFRGQKQTEMTRCRKAN